jgi:uroporphyrinogen-III synthase
LRALVTRPEEEAAAFAAELRERGLEPVLEPLLRISFRRNVEMDLAGVQALLFTSANGARAFAASRARRDFRVFAVGDATAAAARAAGFRSVESAGGDVEDLARVVRARIDPRSGAVFHAAGSAVAGDLSGRLGAAGFTVRRAVLYDAEEAQQFTPETAELLRVGGIELALFFSPRTAHLFATLAAPLPAKLDRSAAMCLSPAVARAVSTLRWRQLRVASSPTQKSLLGALDAMLAGRHDPPQ